MGKTLVFEGCKSCAKPKSLSGYGQFPLAIQSEKIKEMLQGGAVGAGAATVVDMVLPKIPIVRNLSPTVRALAVAGIFAVGSAAYAKRNPEIAAGIGVGGISIALYKLTSALMGRVAQTALSGYGNLEVEETPGFDGLEIEETPGYMGEEPEMVDEMGVIIPTELEGLGVLATSELEGYGQEFIVE